MTHMHTEILSALIDGDPVDAAALAVALEDPDARHALVDFVRLRNAAMSDDTLLPASLQRMPRPGMRRQVLRWTAAAAVLALMFVAGLLTPVTWRGGMKHDAPPEPARIEKFMPGVDWQEGD